MAFTDPKPPQRSDLAKIFKDQRTLKAFEKIFELIPNQLNINEELLQAVQITADNAIAQSFLAIGLINAINELVEVKALEPAFQCTCKEYEDSSPRYEHINLDHIEPSIVMTHEISSLEII